MLKLAGLAFGSNLGVPTRQLCGHFLRDLGVCTGVLFFQIFEYVAFGIASGGEVRKQIEYIGFTLGIDRASIIEMGEGSMV